MIVEFMKIIGTNIEKIYPGRGLLDTILLIACIWSIFMLVGIYILIKLDERKKQVELNKRFYEDSYNKGYIALSEIEKQAGIKEKENG